MTPNNGILLNVALRPIVLNMPFASCSFINLDFSLSHTEHVDDNILLSFAAFNTLGFTIFFLHFKQYVNTFLLNILQV